MTAGYQGDLPDGLYEVDLNDRNYVITITGAVAAVTDGPPRGDPMLVIAGQAQTFLAVASGRLTLKDARGGGLHVEGDHRLAAQFFTALRLTLTEPVATT